MRKNKGITLIALIITIIVMLILVGVTISVSLNGGLFDLAKKAASETNAEAAKEELMSIVLGTMQSGGVYDVAQTKAAIEAAGGTVTGESFPLTVTYKGITVTVDENGSIDGGTSGGGTGAAAIQQKVEWVKENYEAAKSEAQNKGQTTEGENAITDIGIGTDGNIVNLNLWNYIDMGDGDGVALAGYASGSSSSGYSGYAYKNTISESGKIEGTIPEVICKPDGSSLNVKIISNIVDYSEQEKLKVCPEIPKTVESCASMFLGCTSLTSAPTIPSSVTDCVSMFGNCTSLTSAPTIPSSVTECDGMFFGCTSLTSAPTIPSSVTDCNDMFFGCTSLTSAPTIPSSVTNCRSMFYGCTSLTSAPTIPSSVTDCCNMFYGCTSLKGTITINANISSKYNYENMLQNVGSESNRIVLKGTCAYLNEIRATGNSAYITIEQ